MKKVTNNLNIDLIVATWLASDSYTGVSRDKTISATGLLKSTQQQVLSQRAIADPSIEQRVDISTLLSSSIGTALHKSIQDTWEDESARIKGLSALGISPTRMSKIKVNPTEPDPKDFNLFFEHRSERVFNGWTITGQFDLVVNGDVHDFKSTKTYTYINKTKEKDYILQGSIYRWLNPELIKGDFITIHYIFTDWNKNLAINSSTYPNHPFISIQLPLMSLQETETYIAQTLNAIDAYVDSPTLPPCNSKTLMLSDVWQYFSTPTATRASKNFSTALEAQQYLASKGKGSVRKKQGEPKGCSYCNCRGLCDQYKKFVLAGLIKE